MKLVTILFYITLLIVICNNSLLKAQSNIEEVYDYAIRNDTLWVVSGDDFLYYPFGIYKNIDELSVVYSFMNRKSLLNNNRLLDNLYFNRSSIVTVLDTDDSKKIEIVYAKILDSNIILTNGIKVGLDKSEFMNYLPIPLPKNEWNKIHLIVLESALLGVWHYYYYSNNKLDSILFVTDYQLDLSDMEQIFPLQITR